VEQRLLPPCWSRLGLSFITALLLFVACSFGQQPHAYDLSGDFWGTHDPSIIKQDETWYLFATGKAPGGGQFAIRCSNDLQHWRLCGHVFDNIPEWIQKDSPGTKDLWAPDISYYKGGYRLYYAYSLFGKNTSGIALATNTTLDSASPNYEWIDKGLVLRSTANDDYNAIDPNFVIDAQGRSWLDFGSFWSGIKLRRLNDEGKASDEDTKIYALATRHHSSDDAPAKPGLPADWQAIEAPFIVRHSGYYYLFVSWDLCCKGVKSTYRMIAGRAKEITGPYLDQNGTAMMLGGGTEILKSNEEWLGPGGQSLLLGSPHDLIAFHAYDGKTGRPALQISTIDWSGDWPHVALEEHHAPAPPLRR
jgi:arabinan endo-1,5-alpha-L-arabinosidase